MRFDSREVLAVGFAAVVLVGTGFAWADYESRLDDVAASAPVFVPTPAPTPTAEPEPTLAPLGEDPAVVILGDSWADGYAAAPGRGYVRVVAADLGWSARIVPEGTGTGYLDDGPTNAGTYAERVAEMPVNPEVDLVVLQGGLNDAFGDDLDDLDQAVDRTLALVGERFPNAQTLLVGPLAPTSTAEEPVNRVDDKLEAIARRESLLYVSPDDADWFDGDYARYVDERRDNHPNTAGHARFAQRLAAAVRDLQG